jgi:DNA-binding transcriptional LysR family regulator
MDTETVRTFLEVVECASFSRAAEKLHVAQTTVSARIRLLEERLGRPLVVRNKAGVSLTAAGEQFLRFAPTFLQVWERARHQVAVPPHRQAVLAIGGELSLWNPFLLNWLVWMRRTAPEIALRTTLGLPEDLTTQVANGILDLAVLYAPQYRPGLEVELLFEEKLVLVTTSSAPLESAKENYVYVDWGREFALHHSQSFPDLGNPGLFVGLGPLALSYILEVGGSGYFRKRAVHLFLQTGALRLVPDAPEFSYPAYAIYGTNVDQALVRIALDGLRDPAVSDAPKPAKKRAARAKTTLSVSKGAMGEVHRPDRSG